MGCEREIGDLLAEGNDKGATESRAAPDQIQSIPKIAAKGCYAMRVWDCLNGTGEHGDVAGKFESFARSRRTPQGLVRPAKTYPSSRARTRQL
jgi:hypothetical protein